MLQAMPKVVKPNATYHPPKGQTVGYVRVSSFEQNESRQLEGMELDRVFLDKASGKNIQRPQLEALMKFVREGDTVICHSMDRLGRNLVDLQKDGRGADFAQDRRPLHQREPDPHRRRLADGDAAS